MCHTQRRLKTSLPAWPLPAVLPNFPPPTHGGFPSSAAAPAQPGRRHPHSHQDSSREPGVGCQESSPSHTPQIESWAYQGYFGKKGTSVLISWKEKRHRNEIIGPGPTWEKGCCTLESSTQLLFGVRLVNYSFAPPHTEIYASTFEDLKITAQEPVGCWGSFPLSLR